MFVVVFEIIYEAKAAMHLLLKVMFQDPIVKFSPGGLMSDCIPLSGEWGMVYGD